MKKFKPIGTTFIIALFLAAPLQSIAGHWYLGGTLDNATVYKWQASSQENKLATAANWTLTQPRIRKISSKSSSMETVRPYAIELVACIDQASAEDSYTDSNVSNLAAACMFALGW